jgi:hypothetical protein
MQQAQTPTPVVPITSIPDLPNNPNKVTIYLKIKLQAVVARPVGAFNKIKVGVAASG